MTVNAKRNDVLIYSPRVNAYCAVRKFGESSGWKYYDLSPDIVQANVTLNINQASTFDLRLANAGGKYTDFFHTNDRMTITCRKDGDEDIRLITGVVKAADSFQLYGSDVRVTGACCIHILEQHYWDPESVSAFNLLFPESGANLTGTDQDLSHINGMLTTLICEVAGWDESMLEVSDIPDSITESITQLYLANQDVITGQYMLASTSAIDSSATVEVEDQSYMTDLVNQAMSENQAMQAGQQSGAGGE